MISQKTNLFLPIIRMIKTNSYEQVGLGRGWGHSFMEAASLIICKGGGTDNSRSEKTK